MPEYKVMVTVDVSDLVRQGVENHPVALELCWELQKQFEDSEFGYGVCLHEAAHAVLMEQDGWRNIQFKRPSIKYDPGNKMFYAGAGIRGDRPLGAVTNLEFIEQVATHGNAGTVAIELLSGNRDRYKRDDRRDHAAFIKHCENWPPHIPWEDPELIWNRARDAATARIRNRQTTIKVTEKAREFLSILYS
jgi:hypothetical protein